MTTLTKSVNARVPLAGTGGFSPPRGVAVGWSDFFSALTDRLAEFRDVFARPSRTAAEPPSLQFDLRAEDGVTIAAFTGTINLSNSPQVRQLLLELLAENNCWLVVDLGEVSGVDATGWATFIEYFREVRGVGGDVALTRLLPRVKGTFELLRLNELFTVCPDVASAIAAVVGPGTGGGTAVPRHPVRPAASNFLDAKWLGGHQTQFSSQGS